MAESAAFSNLLAYPLRSGVTVPAANRGHGIKMVNMGELFAHPRLNSVEMARVDIDHADAERYLLREGDLLFARRSLTLEGAGKCAIVSNISEDTTWESSIIRARVDLAKADPLYYFYYFKSPQGRRQIEAIVEQVAAAGIRLSELARLPVPTPDVVTQRAVAEVLGALDDKIEANRKFAATADDLVRSWLDRLWRTSEDWVTLGDLVSNVKDIVQPSGELQGYVGLEHLPRRHMWLEAVPEPTEISSTKSAFSKGDVLFGKLRPNFHKVVSAPAHGICSTEILVLRALEKDLLGFALAACASDVVLQEVTRATEGTRMPRTKWKHLSSVEVPWPGVNSARAFSAQVAAVRDSIEAKLREIAILTQLRDTLLPKLVSGQLRVEEAMEMTTQ